MSLKKINTVIAGATGFTGLDLVNTLSKHKMIKITHLCAQKNIGKNIKLFDKRIKKKLPKITHLKSVKWEKVDLIYLSLPNGEAQKIIKLLFYKYKHLKFIDLSGDFRISNPNNYKKWYNLNHKAKKLIKYSKYCVSELSKNEIKNYRIISNPGCYPTSIQLALIPLIKKRLIKFNNIIIDAKSGYSGAGKLYKQKFTHKNFYESVYAYSVESHKHLSEIDQEFKKISKKVSCTFIPYILPTFRGILSTIYVELQKNVTIKNIHNELNKFHKKNKFIKILKINSEIGTGNVLNSNNCEISVCKNRETGKIVIFSAIDNLMKGASGQAIQNMNLLYGLKENYGLK